MTEMWTRPMAEVQQFAANEYVAACGMQDGKYIFTCDAPAGVIHYYDRKGNDINRKASYHPCGETHVTDGPDYYYDGYVDRNKNNKKDPGEEALIWLQPVWGGTNGHASASLTREQIQVERS